VPSAREKIRIREQTKYFIFALFIADSIVALEQN